MRGVSQKQAHAARDAEFLKTFYYEFRHPGVFTNEEEDEEGMTFFTFCLFLYHHDFLGQGHLTHEKAYELFSAEGQMVLNSFEVKLLLENFCEVWYKEKSISRIAEHLTQFNRKSEFDVEAFFKTRAKTPLSHGVLFQEEVLAVVYDHIKALRWCFWHYTRRKSGPNLEHKEEKDADGALKVDGKIGLRNVCRLLMAVKVIPDFIVSAELVDLARMRILESCGQQPGLVTSADEIDSLDPKTLAMLSNLDGKTLFSECAEDPNVHFERILPHEPAYTFYQFVEFITALILIVPPGLLQDDSEHQAERLKSAFKTQLRFPTNEVAENWRLQHLLDDLNHVPDETVLDKISNILPPLPGPPKLKFQKQPSPGDANLLPHGSKPSTRDDTHPVHWGELTFVQGPEPAKAKPPPAKWSTESQVGVWDKREVVWNEGHKYPWMPDDRFILIDEPLLPPPCQFPDVVTLLDACNTHRSNRNFDIALYQLSKARAEWVWQGRNSSSSIAPPGWKPRNFENRTEEFEHVGQLESVLEPPKVGDVLGPVDGFWGDWFKGAVSDEIPAEADLYFWIELSTLLLALQREEAAVMALGRALNQATARLPADHPDRAIIWAALGRMCVLANDHDLAARCYLRCQSIREDTLGSDTVETVTAIHNLAVCFVHLARHGEALAHFNLAHAVFEVLLGIDFPRTQVAHMNLIKSKKKPCLDLALETPLMFWIPYKGTSQGGGGKKKSAAKKGGKKK